MKLKHNAFGTVHYTFSTFTVPRDHLSMIFVCQIAWQLISSCEIIYEKFSSKRIQTKSVWKLKHGGFREYHEI